ncbi:MAG: NADH-quinone oxidoreductase subunit C [Anaerolineales bacterium]|nr:NADH-quinone oxidoreductase subunit C [Anaerolineales bacterium]
MNEHLQSAVQSLKARFSLQESEFRGQVSLVLPAEQLLPVCQALRDEFDFEMLVDETAIDYWPQTAPRFHLLYQLLSLKHNTRLGLRVPLEGNAPSLPTLAGIYPNANWYEREIWDMFGIRFENHSDLRRILMPHDWEGHPLRKDFPLGYEEVMFSFNFDEIDGRKPYVEE